MSLALEESAKEVEARENIKLVTNAILEQEVKKMVEGEEEVDVAFIDSLILSQEDPDTRLEQRSHKERPEDKNDDDDEDDNVDVLIRRKQTGTTTELTDTDVPMYDVPSHSSQQRAKHLRRNLCIKIDEILEKEVPQMVIETTNQQLVIANLCRMVQEEMQNEKNREEFEKSLVLSDTCKRTAFRKCNHDDHSDDPPEGEKGAKKQKMTKESKSANSEVQEVDDDELILEEESPKFLAELKSLVERRAPTMADIYIMKESLDDMMRERCKTVVEYIYHTEQATNYLNNQIVWENTKEELIPHIPKKEALVFFGLQRYPNEPLMFLWNKDFFYLKNGNTEVKKCGN
ncbi:hypothetical protein Tco_1036132 [Tanacetum coccineum]